MQDGRTGSAAPVNWWIVGGVAIGAAARDELVPASDVDVLVEFEDPG